MSLSSRRKEVTGLEGAAKTDQNDEKSQNEPFHDLAAIISLFHGRAGEPVVPTTGATP